MIQSQRFYGGTPLHRATGYRPVPSFWKLLPGRGKALSFPLYAYPIIPYSSLALFFFFFFQSGHPLIFWNMWPSQPIVSPSWDYHLLSRLHHHFVNKFGGRQGFPLSLPSPHTTPTTFQQCNPPNPQVHKSLLSLPGVSASPGARRILGRVLGTCAETQES